MHRCSYSCLLNMSPYITSSIYILSFQQSLRATYCGPLHQVHRSGAHPEVGKHTIVPPSLIPALSIVLPRGISAFQWA